VVISRNQGHDEADHNDQANEIDEIVHIEISRDSPSPSQRAASACVPRTRGRSVKPKPQALSFAGLNPTADMPRFHRQRSRVACAGKANRNIRMRIVLHTVLSAIAALLFTADARAEPLYRDGSWGVVPQDAGSTCVVVLNSEDRRQAFHVLIDGAQNAASVGILDAFLPDFASRTTPTMITVDLGPQFARQLEFTLRSDAGVNYLAADLPREELDTVLDALQSGKRGVSLSFENGVQWRIPPPKSDQAASAIARCSSDALKGLRA
jgi:hypothetical protein